MMFAKSQASGPCSPCGCDGPCNCEYSASRDKPMCSRENAGAMLRRKAAEMCRKADLFQRLAALADAGHEIEEGLYELARLYRV